MKDDPTTLKRRRIYEVGHAYFVKFQKYYKRKYNVNWIQRLESNKSAMTCLEKVLVHIDILKTTVDDYIEAQFFWTDKLYTRAPRYHELCAWYTIKRFEDWTALVNNKNASRRVVNAIESYGMKRQELLDHEFKILERMIRKWGSESKVWQVFGDPDCSEIFSTEF